MATSRLVVVTGASGGIGLELARLAARDGHDLLLVARRTEVLDRVAGELKAAHGVVVETVAADLATDAGTDAVVAKVGGGPVDVLINNAGVGGSGAFATQRAVADDLAMVSLNITALVRLTGGMLPGMVARRSGGVLNVASTAGFLPGPGQSVYYATKAFVRNFSLGLTEEVRGSGVRVTALSPGPVDTGFAEAAGLTGSLLTRFPAMQVSAADVAAAGWSGLASGRAEVVPGLMIRAGMASLRVTPPRLARMLAGRVNR